MTAVTAEREVATAIRGAFGEGAEPHDLSPIGAGRSGASVCSFALGDRRYVVRVPDVARADHARRAARETFCTRMAAERGIGPELIWVEPETGVTITAMIEDVLVGPARALAPGRLERLAKTLRTLHEGPRIEGGGNVFAILDHFDELLRTRRGRGIPPALGDVIRRSAEAARAFGVVAPCHNDLNPSNILETPSRAYLVDWETAGEGDPYVDVAQVGVFGLLDDGRRDELLACWLGHPPTEDERTHARLARVIAQGFYAVSFTAITALTGDAPPEEFPEPRSIRDLLIELARGTARTGEIAASLQRSALAESARLG